MRLVSFRRASGIASYGRLVGDQVHDLGGESGGSLRGALAGEIDLARAGDLLPLADVALLPVIPDPAKIFCIGLNYASHIAEMGNTRQAYPTVFTRWSDTLVAHGRALEKPAATDRFDYEGELAVVIGKPGRAIPRDQAMAHVAGYAIFNDASVRDWQRHSSQFTPGKNFPATAGFGPSLVTPDEIGDLAAQSVRTRLNGATMQDQPIADLIFDVPALIAYLSAFTALAPGDVIATGTPEGIGAKRNPPVWMKSGDVLEVEITKIGTLRSRVIDEK